MGIEIIKGSPRIISGANLPGNIKEGTALKPAETSSADDKGRITDEDIPTKEHVNEAIEKLKQAGEIFNRRLDFRVDEETNRIVVKVVDTTTDKVIKEIPPEELLQLAARIQEMIGVLVDEER